MCDSGFVVNVDMFVNLDVNAAVSVDVGGYESIDRRLHLLWEDSVE